LVRRRKLLKMPVLQDILSMPPLVPVDSNVGSTQEDRRAPRLPHSL
jgi:hypothetical protein